MYQFTPEEEDLLYITRIVAREHGRGWFDTQTMYNRLISHGNEKTVESMYWKFNTFNKRRMETRIGATKAYRLWKRVEPVLYQIWIVSRKILGEPS